MSPDACAAVPGYPEQLRSGRDGAQSTIVLLHNSRARPPATGALQQLDGNRGVIPGMHLVLTAGQQELHFRLKSHS